MLLPCLLHGFGFCRAIPVGTLMCWAGYWATNIGLPKAVQHKADFN